MAHSWWPFGGDDPVAADRAEQRKTGRYPGAGSGPRDLSAIEKEKRKKKWAEEDAAAAQSLANKAAIEAAAKNKKGNAFERVLKGLNPNK